MRTLLSALMALAFSALGPLDAFAEKRVALVIGNSKYAYISPSATPTTMPNSWRKR